MVQPSPARLGLPVLRAAVAPASKGAVIAKYFFHLHDGTFITDHKGRDLPDWESASTRALQVGAEAVAASGAKFWKGEHLRVVVTDAVGTALFELRLSGHVPLDEDILGPHELSSIN
jgi:hypothetical protein